ncbi:MAG: tetratricopeptide repeat protein, partial [Rhodoferax sp.]
YELLAGQRPFSGAHRRATESAVLHAEPLRPSQVPDAPAAAWSKGMARDLDTIVCKSLSKSPAERYATVSAMADDLDRLLRGDTVLARPSSAWYRIGKFITRHRLSSAAVALAVLVLVGFTVSLQLQVHKVTRERDRADRLAQFTSEVFKVADPGEERSAHVTGRELLDTAIVKIDTELRTDPDLRARLVRPMGKAYINLGAMQQAEDLLRREYERAGRELGDMHPATLGLGTELLSLFSTKWQSAPAEALGRSVLARQREVLGAEDRETAVTESLLGRVLAMQGKFDEAIVLVQHSLQVKRARSVPDELEIWTEEGTLADYLVMAGKSDAEQAVEIYRKLASAYEAKLGPGHSKTLIMTNNLALALQKLNRLEEAESLVRRGIARGQVSALPGDPALLDMRTILPVILNARGDFAGAEPLFRASLAAWKQSDGDGSPRVAMAEYNLACNLARLGQKAEALKLLDAALRHNLIPGIAQTMHSDEDLVSLKGEAAFAALVAQVSARYGKAAL